AEKADAERVKSEDPRRGCEGRAVEKRTDAVTHFTGRFVGEGDGEDGARRHVFRSDEMRDAVGDRFGLAAARTGEDKNRALGVRDGFLLLGVEAREEIHYRAIFAFGCAGR